MVKLRGERKFVLVILVIRRMMKIKMLIYKYLETHHSIHLLALFISEIRRERMTNFQKN
jgi:hypothetical protein